MTDEQKKLSKAEQREAKNEAFQILKKELEGNEEGTKALKTLKPSLFGIKAVGKAFGNPKYKIFGDLFEAKGSEVDEMKIFQELKAGRHECNSLIKDLIRKSRPEEIKWVSFDPEKGIYKLVKIGEEVPKDWTGYVPMKKIEDTDEVSLI